MDDRVPYSVRKERLRQAKLSEEAKLKAAKEGKAYVVEVQIPVTPEPILLQSKTPTEEISVMSFGKAAAPVEMVSSVEIVDSIEPEPVMNGVEEAATVVVSSMVFEEEEAPEQADFVVVEEEAPAEAVVSSVEIPAEEPVEEVVAAPEEAEAEAPVVVSAVVVEEEAVVEPEAPVVVEEAAVVVEEAAPVLAEPVVVEEAPVAVEEVQEVVEEPKVEDEVLAAPVVVEEVLAAPEPEAAAPEEPKVEEAPAPVVEENVDIIPAATIPIVLDLIYWRDIKKTGVVFGSMLFILLSLAIFSVLSVVAYLSLAILAVTLSFRVYKNIMQAVQKSGDGHPFKDYLDWDIELNDAKTNKVVKLVMKHFNCTARELRRLFLVEDLVDSIKFGLLLWVLTYIGSWFNGMTLIINSVVIIFTLPKVYETYKVQIDNYLAMARSHFNKILQHLVLLVKPYADSCDKWVQAKLPFLKKKAKAQ